MKFMLRLVVIAVVAVSLALPELAWSQVYFVCRKYNPTKNCFICTNYSSTLPRRTPRPGAPIGAWTRPIIFQV